MIIVQVSVNYDHIETICIHNTAEMKDGKFLYRIVKPMGATGKIWHRREDGWIPLVMKALRLLGKKNES